MTDDLKRIRHHARTMACQLMIGHTQQMPADAMQAFAAGLLDGVRDTLTAYADDKVAYDVIQSVADGAAVPVLKPLSEPL